MARRSAAALQELEQAEDLAEGFHGRKSREAFDISEHHTYRDSLGMLGELEELEVFNWQLWKNEEDLKTFTFSRKGSKVVRLGGSGDRKQLYFNGGDQELPNELLEELGGVGANKDKVSLGYVYSISYWSDKHHLEGSSGRNEAYMHCFGEATFENPDARTDGQADYIIYKPTEKAIAGVLPELIYDRLNGCLELVGGGYEIRDEGIYD